MALDEVWLSEFASRAIAYLRDLEQSLGVRIARIAIDAPSAPRSASVPRRLAELALDRMGISCFKTPSASEFELIKTKVRRHVADGGAEARLPHANQLWMLVGFALFRSLRTQWDCLEVYPQATSAVLGAHSIHKSKRDGLLAQLAAARPHTGWPPAEDRGVEALRAIGYGQLHDCLDTYLAAWVASLDEVDRLALGSGPDDTIWVPQVS